MPSHTNEYPLDSACQEELGIKFSALEQQLVIKSITPKTAASRQPELRMGLALSEVMVRKFVSSVFIRRYWSVERPQCLSLRL